MAVLNLCAIGFCPRPYRVVELASKFRKAGLQGFSVMRIAGSMMLLMFDDDKMLHELLASGKLDEWLENLVLRVGEQCFPIRVTKIEEAIGPKFDCSCELMEELEFSGKHDEKEDAKERIDASAVKGRDSRNNSVGTVVPNSISLKAMNSLEVEKLWETNKLVDWHVMETASWMANENIGMVQRDEEVRYSDVSAECGLREEIQVRASEDVVVNNPTSRGPSNRKGLGSAAKRRLVQRLIRQQRCGMTILQETKLEHIAESVGGDFNVVMWIEERRGCAISARGISEFCEFVEAAAPSDVPIHGKDFSWFGSGNKCSRLDRFLVSKEWFERFDSLVVNNLPRELSNHSPILLRDGNDSLVLKMREMKRVLKEWNRDSFGNIDAQYQEIVGEIEVLDARLNSDELGSNDLQHKRELYSRLWVV
ncbi:hypothetical protein V6N13_063585 [Hibiscus sabdariffa]